MSDDDSTIIASLFLEENLHTEQFMTLDGKDPGLHQIEFVRVGTLGNRVLLVWHDCCCSWFLSLQQV